jgi:hypothetical protein
MMKLFLIAAAASALIASTAHAADLKCTHVPNQGKVVLKLTGLVAASSRVRTGVPYVALALREPPCLTRPHDPQIEGPETITFLHVFMDEQLMPLLGHVVTITGRLGKDPDNTLFVWDAKILDVYDHGLTPGANADP